MSLTAPAKNVHHAIHRMNHAEYERERRRRKRAEAGKGKSVVTATDLGIELSWFEGPKFPMELFLGETAPMAGAASLWLDEAGEPCKPGDEPPTDHEGRSKPREGVRCRYCGHLKRLPHMAACANPDCSRTGMDHKIRPGHRRAEDRKAYKPDPKLKGGK